LLDLGLCIAEFMLPHCDSHNVKLFNLYTV